MPKMFFHQILKKWGRNVLGPTPSIEMEIAPFPFPDLLPEIRNQIYGYALPSGRVSNYDTPASYSTKHSKSISLLFTNRQIYREAVDILYSQTNFAFGIYRWPGDSNFLMRILMRRGGFIASNQAWNKESLARMKYVELEIVWPGYVFSGFTAWAPREQRWGMFMPDHKVDVQELEFFLGNNGGLQALLTGICNVLSELPQLRRINVSWHPLDIFMEHASPPRHKIPTLLRPLKIARRARHGLVINMPIDSPISTTELAEQQRDSGCETTDRLKEHQENVLDRQGDQEIMERM